MSLDIWLNVAACSNCERGNETVFDANITHNLVRMWQLAGVYDALYMSEGKRARDVLNALEGGLAYMRANPGECRQQDAPNGWGTYKDALPWLERLTEACRRYPDASIRISK